MVSINIFGGVTKLSLKSLVLRRKLLKHDWLHLVDRALRVVTIMRCWLDYEVLGWTRLRRTIRRKLVYKFLLWVCEGTFLSYLNINTSLCFINFLNTLDFTSQSLSYLLLLLVIDSLIRYHLDLHWTVLFRRAVNFKNVVFRK